MNVRHEAKRALRRRNRVAVAVWSCTLVIFLAAVSGAQEGGASDWERPTNRCEPACRSGYECRRGECTPVCSPACAEGSLCSADGGCVSAQAAASRLAPASRLPEPVNSCEPSCRSGFTCKQSRCISLCNPLCPADEMCTASGECVSANLAAHADHLDANAGPPPARPRDASADALANVHADVAGLLQFGLTPTIEVGETVSGYLRLRFVNSGVASYLLLGRDADDDLRFGAGAALGFHWFSADDGNMRGFYGGAALEYAFVETLDDNVDFARYQTHALVPQLDLGHRWAFGSFFIGVSGKLGLAIPLHNRVIGIGTNPCRSPGSCREDLSVALIPGIGVDLGWFLPR